MNKCTSIAGTVGNSGNMEVKALYPQKTHVKPEVKTGGDLRATTAEAKKPAKKDK